jgi:hypothetical protein
MSKDINGKWSLSGDEESYFGVFDSAEEAIVEGRAVYGGRKFWIGQAVPPVAPETLFDEGSIESWIDREVLEHDDYAGEWAEGSVAATREQRVELAEQIRPLIAAWLDKYCLRPTHFNIDYTSVRKCDPANNAIGELE